jgi:[histone H3]-lysine36 N-dimethyltransferase SETMAR
MEQRVNVKFCFKLGYTVKQTYELIKKVYGNDSFSYSVTYFWFNRFKNGNESVENLPRHGRPSSSTSEENVEKIKNILQKNKSITLRMLSEEMGISKDTCHNIIKINLNKKKLCSKFVPKNLTEEQKQVRVETCQDLLETSQNDPNFVKKIIAGDESWCYRYDPTGKAQSKEWRGPNSPAKKKIRYSKSKIKTLLISYFDANGMIYHEFVPEGQTVNKEYYQGVLQRLRLQIRRKRPHFWKTGDWFLLHDNARPHKAATIVKFLSKHSISELPHAPYSPDLSPCDYFLFPKIKKKLKGKIFENIDDIKENVTRELNMVTLNQFSDCFASLQKRWQICIQRGGDYFEGDHK